MELWLEQGDHLRRCFIAIVALGAILWLGYVSLLGSSDPLIDRPQFDARYYSEWADQILDPSEEGQLLFAGAYYRAPLYPYWLAMLKGLAGSAANASLIAFVQALLGLAAAAFVAWSLRRSQGALASLAAFVLLLGYQPLIFFSTRYTSEALAIPLMLFALGLVQAEAGLRGRRLELVAVLLGLATLARPNLLLIPLLWAGYELLRGKPRHAVRLLLVVGILLAPVGLRNYLESGHPVLVSSNGGLTLMHGNGPGAVGVYTPVSGMTGTVALQRQEATAMARRLSGEMLDAVEADQYWKRRAVEARLDDLPGSVRLAIVRLLLTFDRWEISLDESPALDTNLLRPLFCVPYALLVVLSAAGLRRPRRMPYAWLALLATLATPLIFYVSSRYRLPFAVILTLPAAVGVVQLARMQAIAWLRGGVAALLIFAVPSIAAQLMPYDQVRANESAVAVAARSQAIIEWARSDEMGSEKDRLHALNQTERALSGAIELSPNSGNLQFAFGSLMQAKGNREAAIGAWLRAWRSDAATGVRAGAAANVAADWIQSGSAADAASLMSEALALAPLHEVCWNNRVVALAAQGQSAAALQAIEEAQRLGVTIAPELIAALVEGAAAEREP